MIAFISAIVLASQLPRSGIVHRSDVDLPFKVEGHGAPVLVLSGGPGFTTDYMQSIIDGVGVDKYQWILIEQRGTPRAKLRKPTAKALEMSAYIADFEALRKQLKLKHWNVMGQSFGSMLAEEYAARQPNVITSLMVLNTPGPDMQSFAYADDNVNRALNDEDRKAIAEVAKADAGDPAAKALDSFLASLPAYFYSRKAAEEARPLFKPGSLDPSTIDFVFANLTREKWDVSKALHRYRGPAIVIQGRQDFLGEWAAIKSAQAMPKGEMCFIEHAGHCAWVDSPRPFFARLGSFMRKNAR